MKNYRFLLPCLLLLPLAPMGCTPNSYTPISEELRDEGGDDPFYEGEMELSGAPLTTLSLDKLEVGTRYIISLANAGAGESHGANIEFRAPGSKAILDVDAVAFLSTELDPLPAIPCSVGEFCPVSADLFPSAAIVEEFNGSFSLEELTPGEVLGARIIFRIAEPETEALEIVATCTEGCL